MLRDRDGFMWFGTQDGLNRYDGKKFKVYQHVPGDTASLSNNYILSMCEDEEGYLWIGTMAGGLNRFDKKAGKFRVYKHQDSISSISDNTVWSVATDRKGVIWAGTSSGLNKLDKQFDLFTLYQDDPDNIGSLITDMVISLFFDSSGDLWVGTVEGLCRFNSSEQSFTLFFNPELNLTEEANTIWSISETPAGQLVTCTNNGVYLMNRYNGEYTRLPGSPIAPPLVAWSVLPGVNGNTWIGTDQGLYKFDHLTTNITSYRNDPGDPNSLSDDYGWCLFMDPAGFLWIGTNNGISKTQVLEEKFHLLSADSLSPISLSSSRVMAILEDSERNLWVGTDGGGLNCVRWDIPGPQVYNTANSPLRSDNIWALAEDRVGHIYIGSYNGGLSRLDKATGKIFNYPMNEDHVYSLPNRRVLALLTASDGKVWVGTRGSGLSCLDPATGRFRVYSPDRDGANGFPSQTVLSIAEDPMGRIWIGTQEGGLALYLPEEDRFKVFSNKIDDAASISDNNVWAVEFDKSGRLWAGTQGGINIADDPGTGPQFRYYSAKDGLKSNIILGIKEDNQGNIWLSTFSGLAKLDVAVMEKLEKGNGNEDDFSMFHPLFTLFDMDHGLQGLEFNQGASHKSRSGILFFGGNGGLNFFTEQEARPSMYKPPVVITGYKLFNREMQFDPGSTLQLTYRDRLFAFEFSSLDYSNPAKNLYAYKMFNFDENWNFMGTQNTATFTNLNPGDYTLLIRGTNSDGVWNLSERALKIHISPPFWKTTWFIVLAATTLLISAFLIIRQIFINQKRKSEKEKELIELQLKTIKSQIDPHFAFNAINTVASFIFTEKPEVTYDYFTQFARMIRSILEDSDKISRPLHEEIDFVKNYLDLQKMRFRDKFEYDVQVDENVVETTEVPKMVVQSYAENAIKHGLMHRPSDGRLSIRVGMTDEILNIVVEDNGVGRERAAELNPGSTHRGFRIMQHITELYRKLYNIKITQEIEDLKDSEGKAAGTRVILRIFLKSTLVS